MKRLLALLVILGVAAVVILFRARLRRCIIGALQTARGKKTVAERLNEYGQTVQERLLPYFQAAKIPYPPERIVFLGLKQEKKLEVWASDPNTQFKLVRIYPILAAQTGIDNIAVIWGARGKCRFQNRLSSSGWALP